MSTAISVEHVLKTYRTGDVANDDVSFEVARGEIFGLLGINGAGKSTIVKQLVGLVRPTAGQVRVLGRTVRPADRKLAQIVGYMPQSAFSLNNLTVGEALYFTSHLRGASSATARHQRDRILDLFDLTSLAKRPSAQLSGGQARLVQLAIALVSRQPILVLDEPTNELDPLKRRLVWEYLRSESRDNGTTVLFITHDAAEAERVVDRVGFMRGARLSQIGRPDELATLASRPLRLEYLAPTDEQEPLPSGFSRSSLQPDLCVAYAHTDELITTARRVPERFLRTLKVTPITVEELFIDDIASDG